MSSSTDESDEGLHLPIGDARSAALLVYEPWLRVLADIEVHRYGREKYSCSDVVQQTLFHAWQDWDQFRGQSEVERKAWLRTILAHQLARLNRHYFKTQKRDAKREVSIQASLERSSLCFEGMLAACHSTPSHQAVRNEQSLQLAAFLERLPADYRRVLVLRQIEELPHEEVAVKMGRSVGAVRMLWMRALAALRDEMLRAGWLDHT